MFNVVQSDEKKAMAISKFVIDNNYALYTHIDTNEIIQSNSGKSSVRLFFITKALLYDVIENEIMTNFESDDVMIYASPVIHISKKFGDKLRVHIKAI
jgi:hypothetical protein